MRVLCVKYSVPGLACYRGYVAYEDIIVVTGTGDVALTCPRQNNNDVLSPIKHGYQGTGATHGASLLPGTELCNRGNYHIT